MAAMSMIQNGFESPIEVVFWNRIAALLKAHE